MREPEGAEVLRYGVLLVAVCSIRTIQSTDGGSP